MKYLRTIIVILTLWLYCEAYASPAYPFPIKVKTRTDSTVIYLQGDENCKFAYTEDGYTIVADGGKWFFAELDEKNKLKATSFELEDKNYRSAALNIFLKSQVEYLSPSRNAVSLRTSYKKKLSHRIKVDGRRKILIVLMSFADCNFKKSANDFEALFNKHGYADDGASGSVYDYYKYVSYGQLELECTVVGPFTASHEMAYYGGNKGMSENDKNPYALFNEALAYAKESVNLNEYDGNNDGYIDNFHIIYAGYGEEAGASSDAIWAHESTFNPITIEEGLKIDRYSCAPELRGNSGSGISRIGPHCHEIGHALGANDYYDTNYSTGGSYLGTGQWDVMASGSWNNEGINPANFNPYVKAYDFGWTEVKEIAGEGIINIAPSCYNADILRLNTSVEDDYFLLENRQQESFDSFVPGHGLLIFHIGAQMDNKRKTNTINATFPQECYVVCASSSAMQPTDYAASYGEINSAGCPFPGIDNNTCFAADTSPAALAQTGDAAGFVLYEIQETIDGDITLNYSTNNSTTVEPLPQEGETIWEETFEDILLSNFWSQHSIINNSKWKINRRFFSGNVESIAELESDTSGFDPQGYYSKTHLISSLFDVDISDYVLSFQCGHSSVGKDSLNVLIMNNEIGEWETIYRNKVTTEYLANKKVLIRSKYIPFYLTFEGVVDKSSFIMLDNIILRRAETTTGHGVCLPVMNNNTIFSIWGNKRNSMLSGLNIIRCNDSTYKKVILK